MLPVIWQYTTVSVPEFKIPPPPPAAEFPEMVLLETTAEPLRTAMPAPA